MVSRNAPCPCGSGRRYKACHGAAGGAGLPAGALDALKQAAMAAQQAGRLDEASDHYARALAIDPADFDALHMLGVTRLMQFRFGEAADLISRALEVRPGVAAAVRNLELARDPRRARAADAYGAWQATRERARDEARAARRRAIAARSDAPGISVVVPVHETPAPLLRACLDGVLAQSYPRWELCIADDASPSPHVAAILREYAARDARVKVAFRDRNGHISAASNSALALATMPWIALLDHDDLLATCALAEVAIALGAHPGTAIAYSDEDKIDEAGRRFEPYFKPAWNPALLRSQNFVSHLGVYRRELVEAVGGFRPGFEGAQDWDLVLRCSERVDGSAIRHVPQVLYHWRATEGSTARGHTQKRYAASAQERTVAEYWSRRGIDASIARIADGHHLRADPKLEPSISLVLLAAASRGGSQDVQRWRAALPAGVIDVEVVELAPGDSPKGEFDAGPLVLGRGEAARINEAVARGKGEVVLLLRDDARPRSPDAVRMLAAHAALPEAGPVGGLLEDALGMPAGGALLLDADVVADAAFVSAATPETSFDLRAALVQNLSAVRGDAMAIRRMLWDEVGGYDVAALDRRYHDVDLCLRAAARGCRPVWHPSAVFRVSGTARVATTARAEGSDAEVMRARYDSALARDPAYHPELDSPPRRFAFRRDGVADEGDAR